MLLDYITSTPLKYSKIQVIYTIILNPPFETLFHTETSSLDNCLYCHGRGLELQLALACASIIHQFIKSETHLCASTLQQLVYSIANTTDGVSSFLAPLFVTVHTFQPD